jgi:hypothetical protein
MHTVSNTRIDRAGLVKGLPMIEKMARKDITPEVC